MKMTNNLDDPSPAFLKKSAGVFRHPLVHLFGLYLFINNELLTTESELKAIAAPAIMGFSSQPVKGNNTPAATGIPTEL